MPEQSKDDKNSGHPKSYLTNLANMKLLTSDSDFLEIVAEIRKVLNIPEDGLQTGEELKEWYQKHVEDSDRMFDDKDHTSRGRAIHDAYKVKEIDYEEFCLRINKHHEEIPLNYIGARVRFLIL